MSEVFNKVVDRELKQDSRFDFRFLSRFLLVVFVFVSPLLLCMVKIVQYSVSLIFIRNGYHPTSMWFVPDANTNNVADHGIALFVYIIPNCYLVLAAVAVVVIGLSSTNNANRSLVITIFGILCAFMLPIIYSVSMSTFLNWCNPFAGM